MIVIIIIMIITLIIIIIINVDIDTYVLPKCVLYIFRDFGNDVDKNQHF